MNLSDAHVGELNHSMECMHAAKFDVKLFHVAWPEMGVPRVHNKHITAVCYGSLVRPVLT